MNCWLFNDINVVNLETLAMIAHDCLKLNTGINNYLVNLSIVLYQVFWCIDNMDNNANINSITIKRKIVHVFI